MKNSNFIIFSTFLIFCNYRLQADLNQFGISDILVPLHTSSQKENLAEDQRIAEEMGDGSTSNMRHKNIVTFTNILNFIPHIEAYFQYLLNTDDQDPQDMQLVQLALKDVSKAKKFLKYTQSTPEDEHKFRDAFNPVVVEVNNYLHTSE